MYNNECSSLLKLQDINKKIYDAKCNNLCWISIPLHELNIDEKFSFRNYFNTLTYYKAEFVILKNTNYGSLKISWTN